MKKNNTNREHIHALPPESLFLSLLHTGSKYATFLHVTSHTETSFPDQCYFVQKTKEGQDVRYRI